MPDTGYIIRTAQGDRGPYSAAQIRAFAAAGKLPLEARIRDQVGTRTVTVRQVVEGTSAFASVATGTEEIETGDSAAPAAAPAPTRPVPRPASAFSAVATGTEEIETGGSAAPAPARPAPRPANQRRTTRTIKRAEGAKSGGTSRTARRTSTPSDPALTRPTGRVARRAPAKSGKGLLIGSIAAGVIAIGVVVWLVVGRKEAPVAPPKPEAKTEAKPAAAAVAVPAAWHGAWEVDLASSRVLAKDDALQPPKVVLDISASALGVSIDDQAKAATVRSATDTHLELEVPGEGAPLAMTLDLDAEGTLRCGFAGKTLILARR